MTDINTLRKEHNLIDIFCTLAEIPSPSGKEDKVADKIVEILSSNGINVYKDSFGNVIASIEPTDSSKKPLLLSSHMDVVGDASAVNIRISDDGKFIEEALYVRFSVELLWNMCNGNKFLLSLKQYPEFCTFPAFNSKNHTITHNSNEKDIRT